jgi:hypothetical protein
VTETTRVWAIPLSLGSGTPLLIVAPRDPEGTFADENFTEQ